MGDERTDAVVIGAGHAGLAMSYCLGELGAAQHLDDALRRLAGRPARALLKAVDIDELLHCCVHE